MAYLKHRIGLYTAHLAVLLTVILNLNDQYRNIIYRPLIIASVLCITNFIIRFVFFRKYMNRNLKDESHTLMSIFIDYSAFCIIAPFLEELIFRVTLQQQLEYLFDKQTCYIINTVLFGIIHLTNQLFVTSDNSITLFYLILLQCANAMIIGYTNHLTGSLLVNFLVHSLYNCASLMSMRLLYIYDNKADKTNDTADDKKLTYQLYIKRRRRSYPSYPILTAKAIKGPEYIFVSKDVFEQYSNTLGQLYGVEQKFQKLK